MFDKLMQGLRVKFKLVKSLFFGLVTLTETNHVGRYDALPGGQYGGDHPAEHVTPAGAVVQAQKSQCAGWFACNGLVQVMHAQAGQGRQITDVMRLPPVGWQVLESGIRCAQGDVLQGVIKTGFVALGGPALAKKSLEQRPALFGQHAAVHVGLVIKLILSKQVDHRACGTGLGLGRAKHHAFEPRMQHRAAAHGAGLQRHVHLAVIETVITQNQGCSPYRVDFCMRRRVVCVNR